MSAYSRFSELPNVLDRTVETAAGRSLFLSRPWFENFVATVVEDPERVKLVAVMLGDDPERAAILPAYAEERAHRLGLRRLTSLSNYYSARFEPLTALPPEESAEVVQALVDDLLGRDWDLLDLSPIDATSPLLRFLRQAFRRRRCLTQEYFAYGNWFLDLGPEPDFATYLASRGSKIRKTAANRARKFDRDPANRFQVVTEPEELEPALVAYDQVYFQRWGKNEPFPEFIPGLVRTAAEHGWLRLGVAWVGDRPAAVQLWLVKDRVAYIFKVAYDEEFRSLSVGSVASLKMFEHVITNDRVREIDFLTGDDEYKQDWMSDRRVLNGLLAFNTRTLRGLAAATRHIGGRSAKRILQRLGAGAHGTA